MGLNARTPVFEVSNKAFSHVEAHIIFNLISTHTLINFHQVLYGLFTLLLISSLRCATAGNAQNARADLDQHCFQKTSGYKFVKKKYPRSALTRLIIGSVVKIKGYFQPKHMLWVLKRTVSLRRFFLAPKTMFKLMDKKILKKFRPIYLFIWRHVR